MIINKKNNNNIESKINEYILKTDLCGEEFIDKTEIIIDIIDKYKKMGEFLKESSDEYLNWINNDICGLINFKRGSMKNIDIQGKNLMNEIDKLMFYENIVSESKIETLLKSLPLYFLLSFYGFTCYKSKAYL
jgi:hypothetical protein